ncbi:hypothetical protein MNBD_GAMMA15-876 [hydrothermal vent metagenome]|uniref:DSBA-like thioredoxin domain-containing protein n=1 Tax=hydrothermal vent metagenome TaxID=652676 RepID=A0A3B0YSZ8_9ZZZZ
MKPLTVEVFSDVLCVWAYGGQVRIDQLKADYSPRVLLQYRFIPVFAAARDRIERDWKTRGSYEGFARHLHEVAANWDHVSLHQGVWLNDRPHSSSVSHLYLKALQILEKTGELSSQPVATFKARSVFEEFLWRTRCAFFEQGLNISCTSVLDELCSSLDLPLTRIHELINNGEAHAGLHIDTELRDRYQIPGSPTIVFNEGRQRLYGNVGYRIIDANISELLDDTNHAGASWC